MMLSAKASGFVRCGLLILLVLLIADIAIVFNLPVIRQVFGTLLLIVLPGLLILFLLKLIEVIPI